MLFHTLVFFLFSLFTTLASCRAFTPDSSLPIPAVDRSLDRRSELAARTYIVDFKSDASEDEIQKHTAWIKDLRVLSEDGHVTRGLKHEFSLGSRGYSAVLDPADVETVRQQPEVSAVRAVAVSPPSSSFGRVVQPPVLNNQLLPPQRQLTTSDGNPVVEAISDLSELFLHPNKGWNFARISHRNFTLGYDFGPWLHNSYLGQGVSVYVLDTGIVVEHPGFKGSTVVRGANFVDGGRGDDVAGHGTMCGGTISGENGVAPNARLVSVKVADDTDRSLADDVVAGINWVVSEPGPNTLKVISLSQYNFTQTPSVTGAIEAAIARGVHVVVCAGNDNRNACSTSPSNSPSAVVVGSIDAFDRIPVKSTSEQAAAGIAAGDMATAYNIEGTNLGPCLTIFAPGSMVPTLDNHVLKAKDEYRYFGWGTSVAAPQVAAIVANRLSEVGPTSPTAMKEWLVSVATRGQIVGERMGSPDLIAFEGKEGPLGGILGG
ncbi:subtilisin-like protein [Aulographum hederae CBS 113979]|uniref:Subtilisin-like protein n=1 Tax=Aulographum hederae CBS 113979 TaxID=1176131 RepID=A0A6G1HCE1_9PEZI|nr:subtilisin-like protein [Aulographum hederae CBS 113979]